MIILDTKKFYQSPRRTLEQFKGLLYNKYQLSLKSGSEPILMLLGLFSEEDVEDAINDLSLDSQNRIYIDSHIRSDKIIRWLEYGGESVKAPNLITKTIKELEKGELKNV